MKRCSCNPQYGLESAAPAHAVLYSVHASGTMVRASCVVWRSHTLYARLHAAGVYVRVNWDLRKGFAPNPRAARVGTGRHVGELPFDLHHRVLAQRVIKPVVGRVSVVARTFSTTLPKFCCCTAFAVQNGTAGYGVYI